MVHNKWDSTCCSLIYFDQSLRDRILGENETVVLLVSFSIEMFKTIFRGKPKSMLISISLMATFIHY